MKLLYYIPPSNDVFNEVKEACISIWRQYDNTYGYVDEKINRIKSIQNVEDNIMCMIAMFDNINITKLSKLLSKEAAIVVYERLESVKSPYSYLFNS